MKQNKNQNRWQGYWHSLKLLLRLVRFCSSLAPKEMAGVMFITIITGLTTLASLVSLQKLIDAVSVVIQTDATRYDDVILWLLSLILIILFTRVLNLFGNVITSHVQEIVKEKCQREIMEKSFRLSLADFDRAEFYDQLKRVNKGMDQRFFSTMSFIFEIVTTFITVFSVLTYLLFVHWMIPLVLIGGSIVFTLIQVRVFKEKYLLDRKQTTPSRKLQYLGGMMTSRDAAPELRLFQLQDHVLRSWNVLNRELIGERLHLARREYRMQLVSSSGHTSVFAIVLIGIMFFGTKGLLSIGQYAAFIRAILSFQNDLNNLMWTGAIVHHDLRYIDDFFTYLDLPEENRRGLRSANGEVLKQGIQFRNVRFSYPDSEEVVLNGFNLEIKSGEKIALIGDNGSGKSTLIKLLLGLYQPVDGDVVVDGVNMKELDLNEWRQRSTAIFQDFQKYELLNVGENIAVGQVEYIEDMTKIRTAAALSGAASMIDEFEEGYDTLLGKQFGGQELSQGQWQKIAVARGYIRDAELLILDEPTASLDAKAEVEIYRQFEQVGKGKTVVYISHRLGVAKLADRIVVLKNGRVEEQGTHEKLMQRKGHYAGMYQLQAQWYQ